MSRIAAMALALMAMLAMPASALGAAEQYVFEIVDETFTLELDDPCTGRTLHGEATENGLVRFTDLGDLGHHQRVAADGIVELYDTDETFVGTWMYQVRFVDAYPPEAQGAVTYWLNGPIVYADGSRAHMRWLEQQVFSKGDVLKRSFINGSCGG